MNERVHLIPIIVLGLTLISCADSERETPPSQVAATASPMLDISDDRWEVVSDLIKKAEQGFYVENGIHIGPGMPGWASVSGHDRSSLWGKGSRIGTAVSSEDKPRIGSWLTARAGSLRFPRNGGGAK